MTYKGYEAKIEYDSKEMIYVGTLSNCSDLVSFHSSNIRVMWKRVNPNVEYVIAAMRKKGEDIKNGISKVRCPEKGKPAAKKKCHSRIRP